MTTTLPTATESPFAAHAEGEETLFLGGFRKRLQASWDRFRYQRI
jgi:hypothetical protein